MKRFSLIALIVAFSSLLSCAITADVKPKVREVKTSCIVNPVVIAVIDTGMGFEAHGTEAHLCKSGHRDFTGGRRSHSFDTEDPVPLDTHGHGTNVAGIIDLALKDTGIPYCIVILKYFTVEQSGPENLQHTIDAFNYARQIKADYINYSGGGVVRNAEEEVVVKKYLDEGGKFVAAAGNEGVSIDLFHFYPASYDPRIVVVGYKKEDGSIAKISNYGKGITRYEMGHNVLAYGLYMSGTSQATAVATGKLVIEDAEKSCDINKKLSKIDR